MTMFNIGELHGGISEHSGNIVGVLEVDYYNADSLLVLSDKEIVKKVKTDLNTILGLVCAKAKVVDAAIVRLPRGVNWYYPGSYKYMPDIKSSDLDNVYCTLLEI